MRHPIRLTLLLLLTPLLTRADDWPQWAGPHRDNVWRESDVLTTFPKDGPRLRWRTPLAGGYSGPAVAAGRVFVTDFRPADPNAPSRGRIDGVERVRCLNEADGKPLWSRDYAVAYTFPYSAGPRATPTVDGDRVYTLGAEGHLHCLNVADGSVVWSTRVLYPGGKTPTWGFASHPLVDGDKIICLSAGTGAVVTAFDKRTGDVLWHDLDAKDSGYSPPMIYDAGGTRQLILWHPEAINSLDPETGKVYWSVPFGPVRYGVSIIAPVFTHDPAAGDTLFIASPNEGSMMLRLNPREPKADVLWKRGGKNERNTEALHALMCTPMIRNGYIYGVCIGGELRCLDARNGDRLWQTYAPTSGEEGRKSWSTAFLIQNGPHYFLPNEHGDLITADLSPKGYSELSRAHLIAPVNTDAGRNVIWSPPAFANKSIYWRNDKEIVCYSLAPEGR